MFKQRREETKMKRKIAMNKKKRVIIFTGRIICSGSGFYKAELPDLQTTCCLLKSS